MRKLLLAIAALVLISVVLLAVAVLSLNRIIAHDHERILQRVAAALGRGVAVDQITVSLWPGFGLRLENFRIADDPRFSHTDFVRAAAVTVRANLWPLLRGELSLSRADLTEPQVQLIRNATGEWNYASLVASATGIQGAASGPPARVVTVALITPEAAPAPALLPYQISRIAVDRGAVVITDLGQQPIQVTRAEQIRLTLNDVGSTTPVRFSLEAALQNETRNVQLRGSVGPLQSSAATPFQIDGTLGPFGARGARIDALQLTGVITPDSVQAAQLDGRTLGGSFTLSGQFPRQASGAATLKGHLTGISLAQLLELRSPEAAREIEGAAQLSTDLHATGTSVAALQRSLAGTVDAAVDHGVIKNMNVVSLALERASGVPGLGNLLSESVTPKYARLLADPHTRFDTLRAQLRIADQRVTADDISVSAPDYNIRASGWVRFDRQADLAGTLLMSQQFSRDVTANVKEAKYVVDDNGQLAIPLRLRGKLGEAKPQPDTDALVALVTRGVERGGATELLQQLLGGKHRKPAAVGTAPTPNGIEEGLRRLFGR